MKQAWICGVLVGMLAASPAMAKVPMAHYDHLMRAFVKAGVVDYGAIARPRPHEVLHGYLKQLETADPRAEGDKKAQLAAWINAYNALVIESVLAGNSPATPAGRERFFKGDTYMLFGARRTLDAIETQAIRLTFADPRVHFALVGAAKGGPGLRSEAYDGARLDAQLDDQVRGFLADASKNQFDAKSHTAKVSPVFKTYASEFGKSGVPRFLARYAPEADKSWLSKPAVPLRYADFDWSLNGKR